VHSYAQRSEVFTNKGYAANGYDVVAYFREGKPVEGKKNFLYQWNDAFWLFSTKQNLDLFSHSPEKYAPQFGGYCTYGVFEGHIKQPLTPMHGQLSIINFISTIIKMCGSYGEKIGLKE